MRRVLNRLEQAERTRQRGRIAPRCRRLHGEDEALPWAAPFLGGSSLCRLTLLVIGISTASDSVADAPGSLRNAGPHLCASTSCCTVRRNEASPPKVMRR